MWTVTRRGDQKGSLQLQYELDAMSNAPTATRECKQAKRDHNKRICMFGPFLARV